MARVERQYNILSACIVYVADHGGDDKEMRYSERAHKLGLMCFEKMYPNQSTTLGHRVHPAIAAIEILSRSAFFFLDPGYISAFSGNPGMVSSSSPPQISVAGAVEVQSVEKVEGV